MTQTPPAPADVSGAAEHPVAFVNGTTELRGALTVPAAPGPHPAVVLVHGAGPSDRSYHGFFAPLQAHLTSRGVAVLWYDKPGWSDPARPDLAPAPGDWRDQDMRDRAEEVLAAVRAAQAHPAVDPARVGVLGYSQGWWAAARAAQSSQIAFAVCLGGAAVSPAEQEAFRVEQELRADGFPDAAVAQALVSLERGIKAAQASLPLSAAAQELGAARDEPWYRYLHFPEDERLWAFLSGLVGHDPRPDLAGLRCPLLVVYGEDDTRLPVRASAARLREILGRAGHTAPEVAFFPHTDHFMFDRAAGAHNSAYLETIAAWVLAQPAQ